MKRIMLFIVLLVFALSLLAQIIQLRQPLILANGTATHANYKGYTYAGQVLCDLGYLDNEEFVLLSTDACFWPEDCPFDIETLPVTLSSFTASYTASNTVSINWQTESESNMIGYYIYRSNSNDVSASERVSSLLTAYNQPETQHYSFTDREIDYETTYYYWLQSCDLDGSNQYHGSICVTTGNGQTIQNPLIPVTTKLNNAYPNPFNPSTTISFDLAGTENVCINIFNIKGQLIKNICNKTYDKGNHSIIWDGKDNQGNSCGTGVYFYKMTAGKTRQSKKMMMIK